MSQKKRVLLVGRHYIIEPLGLIYLAGVARKAGWEVLVHLVKDSDFTSLYEEIASFRPDIVGFTIWTGYHVKTFEACDRVRAMGIPVVIGGPHSTYFTDGCAQHADFVVKGEGFRSFREILEGLCGTGIRFDTVRVAEGFPVADRDTLYQRYPELGSSKIKSIMGSVGCPFTCSYCYAPAYNDMYGGFKLKVRPVDEIIAEAVAIKSRWPTEMIYFQDDIFGFDMKWLAEFAEKWPAQVGVPWHCQIRLELTKDERLDLFRKGGCTGITLAIESGSDFLRHFVLCRHMNHDLIVGGIKKIKERGFTLRTEQILAVPFSSIESDLGTLELNCGLDPEMAWTSILAPYSGTAMGSIASNFRFYTGNNDDIKESFFDRSVLRHVHGGYAAIEPHIRAMNPKTGDNPLLKMSAGPEADKLKAPVLIKGSTDPICELEYLDETSNSRYADQTVMLQRLFNWLSHVPDGHLLGAAIVGSEKLEWTWPNIGSLTRKHFEKRGESGKVERWTHELASRMGVGGPDALPSVVRDNPIYFAHFRGGEKLASQVAALGLFNGGPHGESFDTLGMLARRHLFMHGLYKLEEASEPIASV